MFALTASETLAARCQPTVTDADGPFQQRGVKDIAPSEDRHGHVRRDERGAGLCGLVARALVVFWQAGPKGTARTGAAVFLTESRGEIPHRRTPVPASYGGQAHIHIAVFHPEYEELLSRYVVRRSAKTGRLRLVLTPLL